MAHYVVPVKPAPVTPAPAATLVLIRDRPAGGIECLLMQRHQKSKFAAGAFVFPGGKIETDDNPDGRGGLVSRGSTWRRRPAGWASRALRAPRSATGSAPSARRSRRPGCSSRSARTAAMRRSTAPRFAEYRRACQADNRAFWDMLRKEGLRLATDRLVYFAHWITPEDQPLRFDTRFFAAPAPAGQEPSGDEHEMTDLRWLAPAEAVAASTRGEIMLRNPTVKNLMRFDGARTVAEALDQVRDRPVPNDPAADRRRRRRHTPGPAARRPRVRPSRSARLRVRAAILVE